MFTIYKAKVEKVKNQLNENIKILKFDQGREYESNEFSELCANFDIIHQITVAYTPQQNEIAERKNKTLKEMVNAILVSSESPQKLWREALLIVNQDTSREILSYFI